MAEVIHFPLPFPALPRFAEAVPPEVSLITQGGSLLAEVHGHDCTNGGVTSGATYVVAYASHDDAERDRAALRTDIPQVVLEFFHGHMIAVPAQYRGAKRPWYMNGGHHLVFIHPLLAGQRINVHDRVER